MDFIKKIFRLPTARLSPDTVLHSTIEMLPRIKAVAVVILWDDDSYDTDWSAMSVKELCTGARLLSLETDRALQGGYPAPPRRDGKEGA